MRGNPRIPEAAVFTPRTVNLNNQSDRAIRKRLVRDKLAALPDFASSPLNRIDLPKFVEPDSGSQRTSMLQERSSPHRCHVSPLAESIRWHEVRYAQFPHLNAADQQHPEVTDGGIEGRGPHSLIGAFHFIGPLPGI